MTSLFLNLVKEILLYHLMHVTSILRGVSGATIALQGIKVRVGGEEHHVQIVGQHAKQTVDGHSINVPWEAQGGQGGLAETMVGNQYGLTDSPLVLDSKMSQLNLHALSSQIVTMGFHSSGIQCMGEWNRISISSQINSEGNLRGNSFWLALLKKHIVLGVWGGRVYRFPNHLDIRLFCKELFSYESKNTLSDFPQLLIERFSLTEVHEEAFEELVRTAR